MKKGNMHFHHWLIFGIVNGLVIYISSIIFPSQIVLGNAYVSLLASVVLTALILTAVFSVLPIFQKRLGMDKMDDNLKYIIFALINIVILWLLEYIIILVVINAANKYLYIPIY